MSYSEYPKTDESCLAYARMVTANKGEVRHALRLAPNNPYGVTHAICGNEDLADYLENGCSLIPFSDDDDEDINYFGVVCARDTEW
jgi:hypothetical protein